MARKAKHEHYRCQYFTLLLYRRSDNSFYYADGRSNGPYNLGRHSLGVVDRESAIAALHELDRVMAVQKGLVPQTILENQTEPLTLEEGIEPYLAHVARPASAGGARHSTLKRYKTVFEKFSNFVQSHNVAHWDRVDDDLLGRYLKHLEDAGYAPRSLILEGTTLKQAIKHLIERGRLSPEARLKTRLRKLKESSTYCYTPQEVEAMLNRCRKHDPLEWLGDILEVLAYTGMRVGEAAQLRWKDVDLESRWIHVRDESARPGKNAKTTKTHVSRSVPLNDRALAVLRRRRLAATTKRQVRSAQPRPRLRRPPRRSPQARPRLPTIEAGPHHPDRRRVGTR